MLCPICGTKMKDSFTEVYCPNKDNHRVKRKFRITKGDDDVVWKIFIECDPPKMGEPHYDSYVEYLSQHDNIFCFVSGFHMFFVYDFETENKDLEIEFIQ